MTKMYEKDLKKKRNRKRNPFKEMQENCEKRMNALNKIISKFI